MYTRLFGRGILSLPGSIQSNVVHGCSQYASSHRSAGQSHRELIARRPLRFIRSSSAALPPQVLTELEGVFGTPVIESYGMTEASHQMASNPLPPRQRKMGSVGLAAGPDLAIMDNAGHLLPPGARGEVIIRGANVTSGYLNHPTANQEAFAHGWFRTGDAGFLDADGYLFLTGRLKEMINRGGEKIAPQEVDEVLMNHPAVAQAITFAVPHPNLGEDVAAAVVLRDSTTATAQAIRTFALTRLSAHKVPSRIVIVDAIPKGPTGKLQRVRLAEHFVAHFHTDFVAPRTPTEEVVATIWGEVFAQSTLASTTTFLPSGGIPCSPHGLSPVCKKRSMLTCRSKGYFCSQPWPIKHR